MKYVWSMYEVSMEYLLRLYFVN